MTDVYLVIIEDRHADVDVLIYSDEATAMQRAMDLAREYNNFPEDLEDHELNDSMIRDGWLRYISYSVESDMIRVVKRELK